MTSKDAITSLTSSSNGVGKYLGQQKTASSSAGLESAPGVAGEVARKKRKESGGFGDFSGW